MGLPTPLGPSNTTFSARSMKVKTLSSLISDFRAPVANVKSYCSMVLIDGKLKVLVS